MIADFIIDKMSAYIAGGMDPETASHFTRGELLAIYKGDHRSRGGGGQFTQTAPPEPLDILTAIEKADAGIAEILEFCTQRAGKGPTMDTETKKVESHGTTPDAPPTARNIQSRAKYNGLERLKEYVKGKPA